MRRPAALFAGGVTATVLIALAAGIAAIGSPSELREWRLDAQRTDDLRQIASAVAFHVERTSALPADLDALNTANQPFSYPLVDPVTAEPYEYAPTGPRSYRLCAAFSRPTPPDEDARDPGRTPKFWHHGAGRHCFSIDVVTAQPK